MRSGLPLQTVRRAAARHARPGSLSTGPDAGRLHNTNAGARRAFLCAGVLTACASVRGSSQSACKASCVRSSGCCSASPYSWSWQQRTMATQARPRTAVRARPTPHNRTSSPTSTRTFRRMLKTSGRVCGLMRSHYQASKPVFLPIALRRTLETRVLSAMQAESPRRSNTVST